MMGSMSCYVLLGEHRSRAQYSTSRRKDSKLPLVRRWRPRKGHCSTGTHRCRMHPPLPVQGQGCMPAIPFTELEGCSEQLAHATWQQQAPMRGYIGWAHDTGAEKLSTQNCMTGK